MNNNINTEIEKKIVTKNNDYDETKITVKYITPSISTNEEKNDNLDKLNSGILFDNTNDNQELNTESENDKTNDIQELNNNTELKKDVINSVKKFIPIKLVKAVDTERYKDDIKREKTKVNMDLDTNSLFPGESLLEQEQMSKYDKFKFKVNHEKNVNFSKIGLGKVTRIEAVAFFTNLLIYPAIFFQVWKTYETQEAEDIDIYFNTLQLFGGTPEGAVGVIIGYLIKSAQMIAIGNISGSI
jgi:hypothetical protein